MVPSTLQSVGQRLHARRAGRGYTLDAVTRATKLTRNVLMALEEDRFGDIAAPVYVRGFLRIYGQFLEMDTDALLEAYETQQATLVNLQNSFDNDEPVQPSAAQLPDYLRDVPGPARNLSAAQLFLLVATAAIVGVFLWNVNHKRPLQLAQPTAQIGRAHV